MEQLRQASPVARAAGQTLATQAFALLEWNGKKSRTETLRSAGSAAPGGGNGDGEAAQRLLSRRSAVRVPRRFRAAPRTAAALCCPLVAGRPALRCLDGAAATRTDSSDIVGDNIDDRVAWD